MWIIAGLVFSLALPISRPVVIAPGFATESECADALERLVALVDDGSRALVARCEPRPATEPRR